MGQGTSKEGMKQYHAHHEAIKTGQGQGKQTLLRWYKCRVLTRSATPTNPIKLTELILVRKKCTIPWKTVPFLQNTSHPICKPILHS